MKTKLITSPNRVFQYRGNISGPYIENKIKVDACTSRYDDRHKQMTPQTRLHIYERQIIPAYRLSFFFLFHEV